MWFNLAGMIDKISLPYNQDLLEELTSRHYKYTQDERRKVESKDEYKKRNGKEVSRPCRRFDFVFLPA